MRKLLISLAGAAMVAGACSGIAYAQPPSSLVQLCAATDIEAVDAILAGVADTALVGALAPLASLTVPANPNGVEVNADVTLAQVRDALDCAVDVPTPTTTPMPTATPTETVDPTATPTETPDPTSTFTPRDPDDGQVSVVPRGGVDTGDGSSLK